MKNCAKNSAKIANIIYTILRLMGFIMIQSLLSMMDISIDQNSLTKSPVEHIVPSPDIGGVGTITLN